MKKLRTFLVWFVLILAFVSAFKLLSDPKDELPFTPVREFLEDLSASRIEQVRLTDDGLHVVMKNGMGEYLTEMPIHDTFYDELASKGVPVTSSFAHDDEPGVMASLLTSLLPIAVLVAIVYFLFRRGFKKGGFEITKLRESPAHKLETEATIRFGDVGGCADAKQQLGDLVDFLKAPERWERLGARLPTGVLLEGPAGCGKTLLARAVAGEAGVSFFTVGGSEFVEMFIGVGAARMRDTFETAAKEAPAIVFIDELDALGRRRGSGVGGGHDEREQTLNQLLLSLDGFHDRGQVVVIAATNRADILDRALLRPGRFDRRVRVPQPDRDTRLEILRIHTRNRPLDGDVDLDALADATTAFTGADLENLANEASLLAARRCVTDSNAPATITQTDVDDALASCRSRHRRFTAVDAVLIESASQFMEPPGSAVARLTLRDGTVVEGTVEWADSAFIKLRVDGDAQGVMVPKSRVASIEALPGSDEATAEDIALDMWHGRHPDMA